MGFHLILWFFMFSRVFLLIILSFPLFNCSIHSQNCSPGWKITGFYTPLETDYKSSKRTLVDIEQNGKTLLNSEFVEKVMIEGWGKTTQNWYLGFYSGNWHKSEQPLNSLGQPLSIGQVAVDTNNIPKGSLISIPSIQGAFKNIEFIAVDVGSAIIDQHIDIYTGEGEQAKYKTWNVTGIHQVCIKG